jgi:hypothetical protein
VKADNGAKATHRRFRAFRTGKVEQKWHREDFFVAKTACFLNPKTLTKPLILLGRIKLVAGPGIEPGTQGFSVLCSTN